MSDRRSGEHVRGDLVRIDLGPIQACLAFFLSYGPPHECSLCRVQDIDLTVPPLYFWDVRIKKV